MDLGETVEIFLFSATFPNRKWLDEIPVYPQEHFAYRKKTFWHVLCLERIGIPCCTFVTTIITRSLQIILLSNYSATYNFRTCRDYLAENHLSFPSAPRWVRHSYLPKRATVDPLYLWVINIIKISNTYQVHMITCNMISLMTSRTKVTTHKW